MKDQYTVPEMDIIVFDAEDVITASMKSSGGAGEFPDGGQGDIHIP